MADLFSLLNYSILCSISFLKNLILKCRSGERLLDEETFWERLKILAHDDDGSDGDDDDGVDVIDGDDDDDDDDSDGDW